MAAHERRDMDGADVLPTASTITDASPPPPLREGSRAWCRCTDEELDRLIFQGGSGDVPSSSSVAVPGAPGKDAPPPWLHAGSPDGFASGLFGADSYDDMLWFLSCAAGSHQEDLDGSEVGIEDTTDVADPDRREHEGPAEELFTEREVAMAASAWRRVARLRAFSAQGMSPTGADSGALLSVHQIAAGDLLQALPGVSFSDGGVDVYRSGDLGTVSRVFREATPTHSSSAGDESVEVTWARTGRKSGEACPRDRFRFVRRQVLAPGDLLQALPGREYAINGVEYCRSGDQCTVSRLRRGADSGDQVVEVVCARTGRATPVALGAWMEAFVFVRRQSLEIGDILQALPGVELPEGDGTAFIYRSGDEGTVLRFHRSGGREQRIEVWWANSRRRSDESARWMQWFRLASRRQQPTADGVGPGAGKRRANRFAGAPMAGQEHSVGLPLNSLEVERDCRLSL